jgi:hypothetical protein
MAAMWRCREEIEMRSVQRFSIWVLIGIVLMAFLSLEACAFGTIEARSVREVGGFDSVSFDMNGKLIIVQGDRESLEIKARAEDLEAIVTEVRDGTLHIGRRGPQRTFQLRAPVFTLTVRTLARLEAHSSGSISAGTIRTDMLQITISSSGSIAIGALAASSLEATLHSSGSLRLAGSVNAQSILLTSSGSYSGGGLASRTAAVRSMSSGSAAVRVSDTLVADLRSSGNVRYHGNPVVNGKVTSSGRLFKL